MSKAIDMDLVQKIHKDLIRYAIHHNEELIAIQEGDIYRRVEHESISLYYRGEILLNLQDIGLL